MDDRYWNEALETRPWAEVERWQAGRIEAWLPAVRARSPMYSELLRDQPAGRPIRSLVELAELPLTTKDHVRAAQEAATDHEPFGRNQSAATSDIVQVLCSSGTTGRPLYYALTRSDCDTFADAIANTWFTAGIREADIVAHLVGLPMVAGGLPYADGFRRVGATLAWLGGFATERILTEMRRLRCSALLATTSFGQYLASQWDSVGQQTGLPSRLRTVLCGGEPGLGQPNVRERITASLDIGQLREVMGLGDVLPAMWAECDAEDGMHFNAQQYVAIELVDPATGAPQRWADGAEGEVVYTTFQRDATPMLRYRSRDHVRVIGTECRCGRSSPRIRCIGRTDDMLIYKGMNVFPSALADLILGRFDDSIAIDVEAAAATPTAEPELLGRAIEEEVRQRLQVRVAVTLVPRGTIPRSAYKNSLLAVRPREPR